MAPGLLNIGNEDDVPASTFAGSRLPISDIKIVGFETYGN